ncbi:MAG: metallophosphoesterase [Clostridia bacterium]|nr:metallophosphoesterase [Clostridia bacterium]
MAIFVLGDPHLSLASDKPMDVFGARWENHAEKIKKAWLAQVTDADTVVLAGDLSWAMSLNEAEADLAFFHALPGKKLLLKGNHDYWWDTVSKMNRFFAEREWEDFEFLFNTAYNVEDVALCGTRGWELSAGGEQDQKILARELQRLEQSLSLGEGKEKIAFFHYPPFGEGESPFLPILKKHGVRRCYYGHIHGGKALQTPPQLIDGIEFTLISADALDFSPLKIDLEGKNEQNCQKKVGFWAKLLSLFKSKC